MVAELIGSTEDALASIEERLANTFRTAMSMLSPERKRHHLDIARGTNADERASLAMVVIEEALTDAKLKLARMGEHR